MAARVILAFAALVGGCVAEPPPCEDIAARLLTCDLKPDALACEVLTPAQQEGLYDRLSEKGCEGLWSDDGRHVDTRACEAFAWDCPDPMPAENQPATPRYPVVFVSGIDASEIFDWHPRVPERLQSELGIAVHTVPLPSWAPTEARAAALYDALDDLPGQRFNLVCWAVGGIDCRYLVSPGGLFADDAQGLERASGMVASVTTVATPHRGTDVANVALSATLDTSGTLLATLVGPGGLTGYRAEETVRAALGGLTNEAMNGFNAVVVDHPNVHYQSWAAVSYAGGQPLYPAESDVARWCGEASVELHDTMTELLWATAPFSTRTVDRFGAAVVSPSDGMVSVDSAQWGDFQGCVPADHYDVIGRLGDYGPDPRTGFDAATFYVDVASALALEGL